MRVLVTGGTGLVGQGIQAVAYLYPSLDIICVGSHDGDLRDINQVRNLFQTHSGIDAIIHLAANVGGLYKNMSRPVEMFEDNILINTNVLKIAHEQNINTVVCFLSTCIFPDKPPRYPVTAEMLHDGAPHYSNEGYAYAKRMLDVQCKAYQKQYGRRYFCVVPTNIYGPHDNFHLEDAHVVPALIHKCWLALQEKRPLIVSGDGSPLRQIIHSHDVAKLLLWALTEYEHLSTPLVLCPPSSEVSIRTIVNHIVDAFKFPYEVKYDTSRENGQHKKTVDTDQLAALPHNIQYVSLKEGICDVVKWFVDNVADGIIRK